MRARFSNGDPVTANDVKFSFDTLKSKLAAPQFGAYFAEITKAVVVDPATVRFEFRSANRELPLIAGGVPVFSRKWGLRADGSRIPFDQLAFEQPIGSGPYLIERYDNGRTITYRRNPAYWGPTCRCGWAPTTSNGSSTSCTAMALRGSKRSRPANTMCSSSTSRATGRAATSASVSTAESSSSANSASTTAPACRASS
ncbi:hypothetical protein GPU89_31280 [Burkholderia cepacia]|nr:hypothetical protein [Burkholderia cepacia]